MVTTIYEDKIHDPACILDIGDHPFIKHKSYISYRGAEIASAHKIDKFLRSGYYKPKEDFSDIVLDRIVNGLFNSDDTRRYVMEYADRVGL